jgi:hypothetical protein
MKHATDIFPYAEKRPRETVRTPENRGILFLSRSDGTTLSGGTLSGVQAGGLTANDGLGLLDDLLSLGEDELDVAGVGHVWVDLFADFVSISSFIFLVCTRGKGHVHDRGHGMFGGVA